MRWESGNNSRLLSNAELIRDAKNPSLGELYFQPDRDLNGRVLKLIVAYDNEKFDECDPGRRHVRRRAAGAGVSFVRAERSLAQGKLARPGRCQPRVAGRRARRCRGFAGLAGDRGGRLDRRGAGDLDLPGKRPRRDPGRAIRSTALDQAAYRRKVHRSLPPPVSRRQQGDDDPAIDRGGRPELPGTFSGRKLRPEQGGTSVRWRAVSRPSRATTWRRSSVSMGRWCSRRGLTDFAGR